MKDGFEEGFPPQDVCPSVPKFLIACPAPGLPVRCTLLGDRLITRQKHWDASCTRPIPCTADPDTCRYCMAGMGKFATGYMAAVLTRGRRRVIFQLSAACIESLRAHKVTVPTLRGQLFISERADSRKNSKQTLEPWGLDPCTLLPLEFDPRPTLVVMWGQAEARLLRYEQLGIRPGRNPRRFHGGA